MTTLSIQIENADLVRQGLEDLEADIPKIGRQRMFDAMQRAKKLVTAYPPPPPASTYVRTGTYGRAWKIRRNPRASRTTPGYSLIGNAVQRGRNYTKFVAGDVYGRGQAKIHRDRWKPLRDAVEEEVEKLPPEIEREIGMVARRKGFG